MCICIDWLVYSLYKSVDELCPENKGGKKTKMLNAKMPLKEIIDEIRKASQVCEPCRDMK